MSLFLQKKILSISVIAFFLTLSFNTPIQAQNQSTVIIELFTSEGCSSCPPADLFLKELTEEAEGKNLPISTLSFHVDYWNYLGWPDPYSKADFSKRQRFYAQKLKSSSVYTPQMIVNGIHGFGGYKRDLAQKYISQYVNTENRTTIKLTQDSISKNILTLTYQIYEYPSDSILNIALVENNLKQNVTRGENAGKTLEHANVVRQFSTKDLKQRKGTVQITIPDDVKLSQSAIVAYIQHKGTLQVLGASKLQIKS